jgi:hypothetical protein
MLLNPSPLRGKADVEGLCPEATMNGELFGPTTALAVMGTNFCSTNELAKTKGEVSTWNWLAWSGSD